MAKVYVTEYAGLAQADGFAVNILPMPPSAVSTVVVSAGVSVAAKPLLPTTRFVEISTDATCSFTIGTAGGTVTLSDRRLAANERVIICVPNVAQLPSYRNQPAPPANFVITTSNV